MTSTSVVLHDQVTDNRYSIYPHVERQVTRLHVGEDHVSMLSSEKVINKTKTDKIYSYWRTTRKISANVRTLKSGEKVVRLYEGTGNTKTYMKWIECTFLPQTWENFLANDYVWTEFVNLINRHFPGRIDKQEDWSAHGYSVFKVRGITAMKVCYPLAPLSRSRYVSDDFLHTKITSKVRCAMRKETPTQLVTSLFGKTKYRKDLVKATANYIEAAPSLSVLSILVEMKSAIPVDWIVETLREYTGTGFNGGRYDLASSRVVENTGRQLRRIMLQIPENHKRRFFLSIFSDATSAHLLLDAGNMFHRNRLTNDDMLQVRTIHELHDIAAAREREHLDARWGAATTQEIKYQSKNIELTDFSQKYNNLATETGLTITAPESVDKLREWGHKMGNCIAGYYLQAQTASTYLGGVYNGDKLLANFEITPSGELNQLLGRFNQPLTTDIQRDIIKSLVDCGALTGSYNKAWGVAPGLKLS